MDVNGVPGEYCTGYFGLPVKAYEGNADCGSSFGDGGGYEEPVGCCGGGPDEY